MKSNKRGVRRARTEARKKRMRSRYRNIWQGCSEMDDNPDAIQWNIWRKRLYDKKGPFISDTFINKVTESTERCSRLCTCEYCYPSYHKQEVRHTDSWEEEIKYLDREFSEAMVELLLTTGSDKPTKNRW